MKNRYVVGELVNGDNAFDIGKDYAGVSKSIPDAERQAKYQSEVHGIKCKIYKLVEVKSKKRGKG